MIRRVAFFGGLILGSSLCAWLLGSALAYLFTGKVAVLRLGSDRRLRAELIDPHAQVPIIVPEPIAIPAQEGV